MKIIVFKFFFKISFRNFFIFSVFFIHAYIYVYIRYQITWKSSQIRWKISLVSRMIQMWMSVNRSARNRKAVRRCSILLREWTRCTVFHQFTKSAILSYIRRCSIFFSLLRIWQNILEKQKKKKSNHSRWYLTALYDNYKSFACIC